jgi:hypothetical protein
MKTLQESIIGRKGSYPFTKSMLKPGYIVQYQDGEFAMYFRYEDAARIYRTRSCCSRMRGEGGFFSFEEIDITLCWMPLCDYNDNLTHAESKCDKIYHIITVWPVKTQPQLLDQESLEHLTKGVASIKINR